MTSASSKALAKSPTFGSSLNWASCPLARADVVPGESKVAVGCRRGVVHLHAMRRLARGLESFGEHDRDDLAVMGDVSRFQRLDGGGGITAVTEELCFLQLLGVFVGDDIDQRREPSWRRVRSKPSMRPLAIALVTRYA